MSFPHTIQGHEGEHFNTYAAEAARGLTSIGRHEKGTRMELSDARVYRFGLAGGAELAAAKLAQAIAKDANFDTLAVQAAVAVGDTTIPFTEATTFTAEGDLEGGYIAIESAAALGACYKIAKNRGAASGATTEIVTLQDGQTVQVALTTSHKVTPIWSVWHECIVTPNATATGQLAGVNPVVIATTQYGWFQTQGVATCLADASLVTSNIVIPGSVAGQLGVAVTSSTTLTEAVGYVLEIAPDTDFGLFYLTLMG